MNSVILFLIAVSVMMWILAFVLRFRYIANTLNKIKPVYIDGFLYVSLAVIMFYQTELGKDEAYKYFDPYFLYYTKEVLGGLGAGALALKLFRNTAYSDHQQNKKDEAVISSSREVENLNINGKSVVETKEKFESEKKP